MSQPRLRAALLAEEPGDERFVLGHMVALAALIESQVPLHRLLWDRIRREGHSDETRAIAHDAAEKLATVGQSLADHAELPVADVLDQLFYSFTLLAGSEDEHMPAALDPDMLEDLLRLPGLREWMEQLGGELP